MSGAELAAHFGVANARPSTHDADLSGTVLAELEKALDEAGVTYHKDSRGEIWASIHH